MADSKRIREQYAVVGELIMTASAVDHQLTGVLCELFRAPAHPTMFPLLMSLDGKRKIEAIKSRLKHLANREWRKAVNDYIDGVEKVQVKRNIVAHLQAYIGSDDTLSFVAVDMTRMLKALDLQKRAVKPIDFAQIEDAVHLAQEVLGRGENLIQNLRRLNEALSVKRSGLAV